MEQTNERTPASGMYVLAQLEGRKPEMGAACPAVSMSAVLSVVGSFELQLENEQKWLIYGPATRTHAHEGSKGRRRTNRTNNKYIAHRSHRNRKRYLLAATEVAG